jgi:hypothetical protein
VKRPEDWKWSSLHDYTGTVSAPRGKGSPIPVNQMMMPSDERTRIRRSAAEFLENKTLRCREVAVDSGRGEFTVGGSERAEMGILVKEGLGQRSTIWPG